MYVCFLGLECSVCVWLFLLQVSHAFSYRPFLQHHVKYPPTPPHPTIALLIWALYTFSWYVTRNLGCLIIYICLPMLGASQWVDYKYWKVAGHATPKYDCKSLGLATPRYAALVYWLFGTAGTWNTAKAGRDVLWTALICIKIEPPKATQLSSFLLPGHFFNQGGLTLVTEEETRSLPHTQTHFVINDHHFHLFF